MDSTSLELDGMVEEVETSFPTKLNQNRWKRYQYHGRTISEPYYRLVEFVIADEKTICLFNSRSYKVTISMD